MPIQIVKDDERLTYKSEGSKIFYRRIPTAFRSFVVKKHTKRGKPDWPVITKELMEWAILGWENVQDKGKDIPFAKDMIMALPDDVLTDILEISGATIPQSDEDEETPSKNSGTSSSGK